MGNFVSQSLFTRQVLRELRLLSRQKQALMQAFLFFLMFVAFFPLTIPFDLKILHLICPGIIWLAMSLAIFLASERFYFSDIQCGYLEQWLVYRLSLQTFVCSKWLVHGMVNILGMLVCIPILALLYQLNLSESFALASSLLAGTPALLAMCGLVSAFGADGVNRSVLMLLILFPLMMPILILGSATLSASFQGMSIAPYLALLSALSLSLLFILSFATSSILKICLEN